MFPLFCLLASLTACDIYLSGKAQSSFGMPQLAVDEPLPNRMNVLLLKLENQNILHYRVEEEVYVKAVKELKDGLLSLGINLVEDERIYSHVLCSMEGSKTDFDFMCSWEEDTVKLFNWDFILAGWFGVCSENHPSKAAFYGPYLNNCSRIKMKLIDVSTRRTIWFGEASPSAWTKEAAVHKAIRDFLRLFEKDLKASKDKMGRKSVDPSQGVPQK